MIDWKKKIVEKATIKYPYIDWVPTNIPECYCGLSKGYIIPQFSDDCDCNIEGGFVLFLSDDCYLVLHENTTDKDVDNAMRILNENRN